MDADYIQACSCDYGCPCEFSAPPTRGFCDGGGAWRINTGRFGEVSLDGLGLAFIAHWPKAIHEGNGTVRILIDERATAAQREALLTITSGKAGGMPFEIIVTTFSKALDSVFVPFEFKLDGLNSRAKAGNHIQMSMAPIKNPVTGEPESVKIEHSTGFIFKTADCASAEEMRVTSGELTFSWPKKAGFVTRVQYSN
jgi:hypothetical protein